MTTAKVQDNFVSDLPKLNSDELSHDVIMDADGNYYYQSSNSIVKVEPKKETVFVIPQNRRETSAVAASGSAKKSKVDISEVKVLNYLDVTVNNAHDTTSTDICNQEKVYEFDENEPNPDDPQELTDPDYESKGIIIKVATKSAQKPTTFSCMICSYETNKKFLLSRHLKKHCDERPYKCDICERGFKTNAALINHRNIHLGRKPHACASCDMAFTTSGELVRHVRYRHTHIKPHKCNECDYRSVEMSKLRRHMRCHTGEKPYQCPHCTYASPDSFKLKRHMRTHTGEKPYECDICHARFTQSNSLKYHRLIHSVNEKPVFQCNLCPTTCGRKTDLRLHIQKLHTSDHPIPCKRCGKELPDRYTYKIHIKTHQGEKCFRCQYCPYASISQTHLQTHILLHLGAKPFVCKICNSGFRQKQNLIRHTQMYHSDNYVPPKHRTKDHKCPHCNRMFAFKGNLIRHMEVHDPDSKLLEKKDVLKLGRLKRVQADGTVYTISPSKQFSNLSDENEELLYDGTGEEQQTDDDEKIQEQEFEEEEVYNEDDIQYVYDEYEADEFEEQIEEFQNDDPQEATNPKTILIDVKQENVQTTVIDQTSLKKDVVVKVEGSPVSEIMVLDDQDDQEFVLIEVLPDDEGNNDQQQEEQIVQQARSHKIKPIIINKNANSSRNKKSHKNSQCLISDYFGFEVDTEEENEETKGAIKLLELIEQE